LQLGEEVDQMMESGFEILMTEFRPDDIGRNVPLASSPVTGWITY